MIKNIALCPNPFRDCGLEITRKAKSLLEENGYNVSVCPVFGADDKDAIPDDFVLSTWQEISDKADMFVIVGGDGTILHAAAALDHIDKPFLGINLGTKGFMSVLEPEDMTLILDAAKGNYLSSKRMMLDVQLIRNGEVIYSDCALNDAVIHAMGDCIKLSALCDKDRVMSFSGDGIIVSTPTGSTGYSMSAGGPIVEPDARNIIISPICAHIIGAKSFVLGPNRTVIVKAEKIHDRKAYVSIDGGDGVELQNNDIVVCKQSEKTINLIHLGKKSFYDSTFDKLLYKNI